MLGLNPTEQRVKVLADLYIEGNERGAAARAPETEAR